VYWHCQWAVPDMGWLCHSLNSPWAGFVLGWAGHGLSGRSPIHPTASLVVDCARNALGQAWAGLAVA
jgi:hypothetical protein